MKHIPTTLVAVAVLLDPAKTLQAVEGFGTCFNELGWASLSELSEADRTGIIRDLFSPDGRTVLLLANKEDAPKTVSVELAGRVRTYELPAGSVNTIVL